MKILFVVAMPTEGRHFISKFKMKKIGSIINFYPLYYSKIKNKKIYLILTHVGSINAPIATALALKEIRPDAVIKIGCVGSNAPGIKANDFFVPSLFFHSGAWVTRAYTNKKPTENSALWQTLYGDLPYQNNKDNLGGLDYTFKPDKALTSKYKEILNRENIKYFEGPLGGGDMVIFNRKFMDNIRENILGIDDPNAP